MVKISSSWAQEGKKKLSKYLVLNRGWLSKVNALPLLESPWQVLNFNKLLVRIVMTLFPVRNGEHSCKYNCVNLKYCHCVWGFKGDSLCYIRAQVTHFEVTKCHTFSKKPWYFLGRKILQCIVLPWICFATMMFIPQNI